jgi:hypothetical protein
MSVLYLCNVVEVKHKVHYSSYPVMPYAALVLSFCPWKTETEGESQHQPEHHQGQPANSQPSPVKQ